MDVLGIKYIGKIYLKNYITEDEIKTTCFSKIFSCLKIPIILHLLYWCAFEERLLVSSLFAINNVRKLVIGKQRLRMHYRFIIQSEHHFTMFCEELVASRMNLIIRIVFFKMGYHFQEIVLCMYMGACLCYKRYLWTKITNQKFVNTILGILFKNRE